MKVLLDSNILIDYLNGVDAARDELERHSGAAISMLTWIEVMAGTTPEDESRIRKFLARFLLLPLTPQVAERTVSLRRERRLKLPDAAILATAEVHGRLLVTRNTRDFSVEDPGIRIPYRI